MDKKAELDEGERDLILFSKAILVGRLGLARIVIAGDFRK